MEFSEARTLAMDLVVPGGWEWVSLQDALGRILAETIVSDRDLPGEPRSRFDGFAVCSSDIVDTEAQGPVSLRILSGLLAAGHSSKQDVQPGECLRILTGAPLPLHADTVVPQEEALQEANRLILNRAYSRGSGVTSPGEEIKRGESLLFAGEILSPTRCALVAALGRERIKVHRRPRVALLATGDEVIELGDSTQGPYTYCNNRYLLAWLVALQGADPVSLGRAKDDPLDIVQRLQDVKADFVITTGGMGRGNRDFVLDVWRRLGVQEHFRQINLSPGKNSALGSRGRQVFWGLPGNPWGAQVVFQEVVAPALRRLAGCGNPEAPSFQAVLKTPLKKKKGIVKVFRGVLDTRTIPPSFSVYGGRRRSLFADLKSSFAYMLLDAPVVEVAAGEEVRVFLHDFPLLAHPLIGTV